MKIASQFTFQKVRHDQENEVHLVLSLTAPKIDWQAKRPPVAITMVADVSGSMSGEKLLYAQQSMMKLVDHLQPGDFCSLVAFESRVHDIFAPVEITLPRKNELRAKIGALHVLGGTNFSGGMLQGLEWSNKLDVSDGVIRRIIMFTDGCANEGVARKREDIVKLLKTSRGRTSLSAFGYGSDADHELMADVSKEGQGNFAFIKNPDDALSAFAKELGGLLSTYAQNIEIRVEPHNGHKVLEVVSDVEVVDDNGKPTLKIPDILSEESRHFVIRMNLSQQAQALPRDMNAADVHISYDLVDEHGKKTTKKEVVKAKIRFVKPGDEQTHPTTEVDALVGLAQVVRKQIEAENLAKSGDFQGAYTTLDSMGVDFERRGHSKLGIAVKGLAASGYGNHSDYVKTSSLRQSVNKGITRGYGTHSDAESANLICEMGVSAVSNSAQDAMIQSFTSDNLHVQPNAINVAAPIAVQATVNLSPGVPVVIGSAQPASPKKKPSLAKKRSKRW